MTENQKRLVIVGATGMVGGYALRYALDHAAVGAATANRVAREASRLSRGVIVSRLGVVYLRP